MTPRTIRTTLMGIGWTLVFTALVAAQQPAMPGQMPSMGDMMQECQTYCEVTTMSIDQLTVQMKEAAESNDPTQMRTALTQAQQPLKEMKEHIGMCRDMMRMMQGMQGGMGHMQRK
jgi:hypothetical protein